MAATPNASERLHSAWLGARAGRHAEALGEYVWFYEHALEENRHLAPVRLSFALAYWKDLAKVYPPALDELMRIRNREMDRLLAGARDWDLFHAVVSINERLGLDYETHALFETVAAQDPHFAKRCCSIALPSLIDAGDFALAARFLPDSESTVREHAGFLNRRFARRRGRRFDPAPVFDAEVDNYTRLVKEHMAVLAGCGRLDEAATLGVLAVNLIPATTLRRAVRTALLPSARPWYERGEPRRRSRRV
jgi:hypothetical protein